jgi:hypothetical protein
MVDRHNEILTPTTHAVQNSSKYPRRTLADKINIRATPKEKTRFIGLRLLRNNDYLLNHNRENTMTEILQH